MDKENSELYTAKRLVENTQSQIDWTLQLLRNKRKLPLHKAILRPSDAEGIQVAKSSKPTKKYDGRDVFPICKMEPTADA